MKPPRPIYLDYAAATPVAPFVRAAMEPYDSELFYNPSSAYLPAVQVRRDYEAAKQTLARSFGGKGDECIMTAGATESINLVFSHVRGHVVSTQIEHPAVLAALSQVEHTLVEVNARGRVDVDSVAAAITDDTEMISIGLANSEIGTIQPLRKIAQIVNKVREQRREKGNKTPLLLHSDASQGFGQIDINAHRLGVDFLTLNAAKIYGPKQVGLLWAKSSAHLEPVVRGGGQEGGLRSGTENVAGVIGFAAAAEHAARHHTAEGKRLARLRDQLEDLLLTAFPDTVVFGDPKHRLPSVLSLGFAGIDAERIIFMLEDQLLISTGSACSANKHTASHVLLAIQTDAARIGGSLRLTLGKPTTELEIETAANILIDAVQAEYKRVKS